MFRKKPTTTPTLKASAFQAVPDSAGTAATRAGLAQARVDLVAAQESLQQLDAQLEGPNQRLTKALATWTALQIATARHALGEDCPKPDADKLSDAIGEHALAEQKAVSARVRVADERQHLTTDIERLQRRIGELELAIVQGEFQDSLLAYREAIRPAVPLARAVRASAAKLHKDCSVQPLLIDPDADYGELLFGAVI